MAQWMTLMVNSVLIWGLKADYREPRHFAVCFLTSLFHHNATVNGNTNDEHKRIQSWRVFENETLNFSNKWTCCSSKRITILAQMFIPPTTSIYQGASVRHHPSLSLLAPSLCLLLFFSLLVGIFPACITNSLGYSSFYSCLPVCAMWNLWYLHSYSNYCVSW